MYAISNYEFYHGDTQHNIFVSINEKSFAFELDFIQRSLFEKYIFFLYWANETQGAPAEDVSAQSKFEKVFQIFCILCLKIYLSFLTAEFVNLISLKKTYYQNHLTQVELISEWMSHRQMPLKIRKRILNYYNCLWKKFKGMKDFEVLSFLPATIKDEILLTILNDIIGKIKFFPKDNPEIILSIAKKLRIFALPKGEFLCKHGEINVEMHFIIEGYAAVLSYPNYQAICLLKPGDYYREDDSLPAFGETIIHKNSVKAISDLTVAILSLKDLIFLSKEYSILESYLDRIKTNKKESFHLENESILDSSLLASETSKNLSLINEERESEMTYSKREVSSANLTKLIAISHLSQVIVPFKSKMVIEESDENLEISIKLDSHDIFDTPPQLLSSFKSLNNTTEIDLSLIKSHLACSFESDENLDLEFILKDLVSNTPIEDGNLKELKEEKSIENSDLLEESFEDLDIKNEAVLEISSFLMQSDDSDTENFVQEKVSIKQKIVLFIKGACFRSFINRKKVKVFLLFYISFFNAFYVPLNLIFDGFNYPIFILMIELMNTLFLAYLFFKKATKYNRALKRRDKQNKVKINTHKLTRDDENAIIIHLKTRSEIYRMLFFEFLYVIPFPLILEKIGLSHGLFFVLNLPRIVNVKPIIHGLRVFKEKNRLLGSILMILVLSIVFIHLFACILIAVALAQPDFNHSLLRKIPAPEYYIYKGVREKLDVTDSSIYIHGLYWVYATVSKSGVMEMQVVSLPERGFSIFVMTVGGLFYIFVFGNMVSLIEDLTPKMKSIMEKQEKKVMKLVRRLNFQALDERFESYFTHIWKSEKGFNENELLNNLPSDIKVSLQKSQYLPIFKKSNFFTHGKLIPQADSSLIYSLFKFLLSEVFIPEDIIIIAGDFCSKVYFILEGRVELFSLNLKQKIILHPGDFFGNILSDQRQPGYVRAITYCKIGYLNQETFDIMKERFPVWKDKMVSQMLGYKKTLLTDLSFFNEGDNKCNDSVNLKNKVIDEKLIEHYYSFYLKIELEKNDEKKNEKNIKNELEGLKNSNRFGFSSRKIAKTEGFEDLIRVSPSSKRHQRQNIVHLMSQKTIEMPNLFTRLKRLSSCGNAFSNSTTLTKIINIKTLYDLKSSYCILSNSRTRVFFDLLHIFFIIYNTFALPFYIGFAIELSTAVLLLEIAYISENLIHILVELKTSQYIDGILTTDITTLLKNYTKTGLIFLDIFCILPLNLSLMPYYNIYTSLIRITRISQSFYLNFYLKGLESNNRAFAPFIAIFKAFFVLACIWHWSSCYWFWINECVEGGAKAEEQSWFLANHLDKEGLAYQYAMALYFSMNIATTANFPDQSPMNNTERVCFFIMIYVGDACFATAFAIISSNTAVFPLKFNEIFKSINRLRLMLQDSKVSNHVLKRMEEYYAFLVKLRQQNQSSLISLKNYIPEHMFQELRYLIAKPFLINFPIFNGLKSPMLLREVAEKLEYAMYLPRDYIIFRNDIGEEMYFIIEGNVLVMTPREDTVIVILKKGNFFGEIALFTESSRRICSVISGSFCELFVLNKIYLTRILDHHPHIKDLFQKESDRRMAEYRGQSLVNKSLKKIKEYNFPRNKPKRSLSFNITKINDENNIDDFLIEDLAPKAQKIVSYADNKEKDQKIKITRWKTNNFISKSLLRKELSFKIPKNSFGNVDHEESRPNIVENGFNSIGIKINETPKSPDRELLSPEIKSPSSPSKIFDKSKNNNLLLAKSQKNSPFGKKFLFLMENFDSDEEPNDKEELDGSLCEYVEENELEPENMNKKRQSRRKKRRFKERRYSRISLRKEVNFSKNLGIELEWGINVNED